MIWDIFLTLLFKLPHRLHCSLFNQWFQFYYLVIEPCVVDRTLKSSNYLLFQLSFRTFSFQTVVYSCHLMPLVFDECMYISWCSIAENGLFFLEELHFSVSWFLRSFHYSIFFEGSNWRLCFAVVSILRMTRPVFLTHWASLKIVTKSKLFTLFNRCHVKCFQCKRKTFRT